MNYYEPLIYRIPEDEDGFVLRTILLKRLHLSRKLISKVKQTERGILVNGDRQYINVKVRAADLIEVHMAHEQSEDILPQNLPIHILFEDEYVVVVNKASGMIVHPTHGHYVNTLANAVVYHWQQLHKFHRFRPLHRLDQETSGVLAIAKNPYIHQQVSNQFIAHQVKKEYYAFVWGVVAQDQGTIEAPIDRSTDDPHRRAVISTGYSATTHYEVIERFHKATWIRLRLETGRTHQIRVHSAHIGHPLVGDKTYTIDRYAQSQEDVQSFFHRQALHAYSLGFIHPITKQWTEFCAPWPEDLSALHHFLKTYQ